MKVSYSIDISSKVDKVWSWLGTPERAMVWQTSVSKTEIIQETPNMIGTTFRETITENGKSVEMLGTITDYRENQVLAMNSSGIYNTVEIEWQLEEIKNGTRLSFRANIRFKSSLKVLSILFRPVFKRKIVIQLKEELARLKELCEQES
ncbi:SRPBCC family protein [Chloroflexota bacterium]